MLIIRIGRAARRVTSAFAAVLFVMTALTAAHASPNIATILRKAPTGEPTNSDTLTWLITLTEPVTNIDPADFVVTGTTAALALVPLALDDEDCSQTWDAHLSGGDLAGLNATVTLTVSDTQDIRGCLGDGEAMTHPGPNGTNHNTFVVDNTNPNVEITGVPQRTNQDFTSTVTFDETVSGFEAADVTGGAKGTFVEITPGKAWTLAVTPSADYTIAVSAAVATDSAGNGNAEATASGVYSTAPSPPPPPPPPPLRPVAPTLTGESTTSVTVSWTAPTTDGTPIGGYDLRERTGGDGEWTEGPQVVADTSAIIEGLDPDSEYEVQVRSNSASGDGAWTDLGMVRTEILVLYDFFSVSLDLDASDRDQYVSMLSVSPGGVVPVQVFGADIRGTRSLDLRVGYDTTQVVFSGFDVGDALPGVSALVNQDSTTVEIGISSLGGRATVDSGLVGTLRFRTTDALSETETRVAGVDLVRGEHPEAMTRSVSTLLQAVVPPSADFDGSGLVAFADFVGFAGVFGYEEGDAEFEARYDLNDNGGIGFEDFVIFAKSFGGTVNRAPVFTVATPVTRSVDENTPGEQPIGDPITAIDDDGDALTYSLWGADADHFAIDASTGQIFTKSTYDFEKKKGYAVIVRASDGRGGSISIVVSIAVTDVDD